MFNLVGFPEGCVITSQKWLDGYLQPSDTQIMGKGQSKIRVACNSDPLESRFFEI